MTEQELLSLLENELKTIQTLSGRPAEAVGGNTRPIGHLDGFDSHNGLELTVAIESALDIEFQNSENLCVEDLPSGARVARTVGSIVGRIFELFPELKSP